MVFCVIALAGVVIAVGCNTAQPSPVPGPAEKAGAALDRAVDKLEDATKRAAKKTGETIEKIGEAVEKTGSDIKNKDNTTSSK
ncbi:MAG: hypothetical protein HQM10_24620 [Candidatus Riflebacteria bacterium]|nr:hypothetical protein [Candidatus Riflebacteria bacterium]